MIEISYSYDLEKGEQKLPKLTTLLKELSLERDTNIIDEMIKQYSALKKKQIQMAELPMNIKKAEPDQLDLLMIEAMNNKTSKEYYSFDEFEAYLDMED